MRKRTGILVLLIALVAGVLMLSGCVRGSGNVITEQRQVSGFDRIDVAGSGKLIVTQGNTEGVTVEAEDNIISKIETVVEDGVLKVGTPRVWFNAIWPRKDIVFRVTARDLKAVTFGGSGEISNAGTFETNELTVNIRGSGTVNLAVKVHKLVAEVDGSGTVTLSGTADRVELDCSGSGAFHARNLAAADGEVNISGSGKAEVNASRTLVVNVSGSGNVAYTGNPVVKQHISGSGGLSRLAQ